MEGTSGLGAETLDIDPSFMPRQYSPVWKEPLPDWREALDKVCAGMASTVLPPIFFRADNIGVHSNAFDLLCRLFRFHEVPLAMSVIPAWLCETRQERLFQTAPIDEEHWSWHQHGWRHVNWQKSGQKSEFGSDRTSDCQLQDIHRGFAKMELTFGSNFVRVFAPPWNHFSTDTLKSLHALGFKGLSSADSCRPVPKLCHGMLSLPTRLDLHTRGCRDAVADFALLIEQITALSKVVGPTGIVINHHRMSPFAFQFLDRMIYNLKNVIKVRFLSFKELLKCSDEKRSGSRLC